MSDPTSAPAGDIALTWGPTLLAGDLSVVLNDIAAGDELLSAVLLSLFTDRIADPGDVLPGGANDRRGWWGDSFSRDVAHAGARFRKRLGCPPSPPQP